MREWARIPILMERSTRDIGVMVFKMGVGRKSPMNSCLRAHLSMVERKAKVNSYGILKVYMKVKFTKMVCMVLGSINGAIIKFMKDIGKIMK